MVRLALITFNTEEIEFCGNIEEHKKYDTHRIMGQVVGTTNRNSTTCILPNFIPKLMEFISVGGVKPDILAIGLQESTETTGKADQIFQSIKNAENSAYDLVAKEKNLGIGKEFVKGDLTAVRGTRLGVFALKTMSNTVSVDFVSVRLTGFTGSMAKSGIHAKVKYGNKTI